MKNFKCFNLLLVLGMLFSLIACGGGNQVVYVPAPVPDVSLVQREAKQQLNAFREHIRHGRFEPAAIAAEELLTRYESRNQQLEAAIYTDLCLCALESAGDMDAFNRYSGKLSDATSGQEVLTRDTQFVLELSEYFSARGARRDPRVAADLSDGIGILFK